MAFLRGPLGWLVGALVVCVAISVTHLPPRGTSRESRATLSGVMTGPPTTERMRANELAKEWRRAALNLRLHEWRQRLAPELERLRSASKPTLVITIDTTWSAVVRDRAERLITNAWQDLDLGTTKIGVAVVIEPEQVAAAAAAHNSAAYLLPDSAERHTCVAWYAPRAAFAVSLERDDPRSQGWHADWGRSVLGICAFYARFGRPSPEVERWLAQRKHRFAHSPVWDTTWAGLWRTFGQPWLGSVASQRERNERDAQVRRLYPPLALGCMAGHATACAAAVGRTPGGGAPPRLVTRTSGFEYDLPGSAQLFSDMIREFGTARFARFWISDLVPDSAFHAAMDTTLGDWLVSRQRAFDTMLDAGPLPGVGASAWALGIAALALGLAIAAATRRQAG